MHYLDLTLPSMAENLALDEALLELADAGSDEVEILRVWRADAACVVLGRSSRASDEVDLAAADALAAPVYRRVSGGASVLVGPGCMFYSLILSLRRRPVSLLSECVLPT